jgi:hypothetical protein
MMASTIHFVAFPDRRVKSSRDSLLDLPSNGTAIMYGRNSEGGIRVYARSLVHQRFVQVGLFDLYEVADLYVKQLREDDKFRRSEIKCAKQLAPFKP